MLFKPSWEYKSEIRMFPQLLLDAADYMEKHGQCKNTAMDAEGRVCILGAIAQVGGCASEAFDILSKFMDVLNYNATHTGEQVVAKLREVSRRMQ